MKKRRIGLLCAAVCLVCTGCAAGKQSSRDSEKEREQIVLWSYYETEAQKDALDQLMDGFNLSQDIYEASWEYVPMTEFTKRLTMAYTEEVLPDLAMIDNPNMPVCIQMGMFEDITEFLQELEVEDHYYPSLLKTVSYDGRMYGLPAVCNNTVLICNKKYLVEAGIDPPETWEELEEAAATLTTEERNGFLLSGIEGEQGAFQLLPWILSTGEPQDQIGGEGTVKAFAYINNLMEKGYMTRNCINLSQTDVARVFISGEVAMMENGPWVFPMLDEAGMDYEVSALPVDRQCSVIAGGENLGVLKGKNVEGAKCFLEYYHQDKVIGQFCNQTGALPTKMGISAQAWPKMQVIQEQMENALVRSEIPSWNYLSKELTGVFYQMAAGEKTPEEAAAALREDKN